MTAPRELEAFSIHYDPIGSWWFVAVVAVLLAALLLAVPPDRSRLSGRRRATLVALRLGAFLALVACMLRPTLVATRQARQQATVIVLADGSESMTVADGPDGRTRWAQMTEALAAARPAAAALTAAGDVDLAVWRFDRDLHPVPAAGDDPFALGAWADSAAADETAIGAALDEGLRDAAGRTLAGVLVLSDGAQHAYAPRDLPPQSAARRVADAGVPLWSITFGQPRGVGQARDAALVNLAVAETVYRKNELQVDGRVRLEGLAGTRAAVVLLAENEAGAMVEAARTTVAATGDTVETPVRLTWTPTGLGERKLTLRIEPVEGEVIVANNELSTFVDVVDGGIRVLYLEGAPRVEQRFLRRAIAASPDMQVDFEWIDSGQRDRWPVDLGPALRADSNVFLIGDLDASALRPADARTMLERVDKGAGIAFLGGFHAFEAGGWGSSPLAELLPFEADPLARQRFGEPIRERQHLPGPLRMVPDARFGGVSILRLGRTDAETRAAWETLPPLEGATVLGRLVPAAKPLAATPEGVPLLVAREYGAGRVLAFAADSTWRWAMHGAGAQHRRFWRQMMLWLARQDDAAEETLWVRPAQRRISPGTPLPFDAGIARADGGPTVDVAFEAAVIDPAGQRRAVRVARQGDAFGGTVGGCSEPGDWKLVVRVTRPGEAGPRERVARFTVFRQDLELANPRANPLLMEQLTEGTGGGPRLPEEIGDIFAEIANRPPTFESREQWSYSPWDSWPMLLTLAGCLGVEWFLRKRWGLV